MGYPALLRHIPCHQQNYYIVLFINKLFRSQFLLNGIRDIAKGDVPVIANYKNVSLIYLTV